MLYRRKNWKYPVSAPKSGYHRKHAFSAHNIWLPKLARNFFSSKFTEKYGLTPKKSLQLHAKVCMSFLWHVKPKFTRFLLQNSHFLTQNGFRWSRNNCIECCPNEWEATRSRKACKTLFPCCIAQKMGNIQFQPINQVITENMHFLHLI